MTANDMLNSIGDTKFNDDNKIRRGRGRPTKNAISDKQLNMKKNVEQSVCLYLKITEDDIKEFRNKGISYVDIINELNDNECNDLRQSQEKIKKLELLLLECKRKLSEKDEIIKQLTPMFQTEEIKYYPEGINIVDIKNIPIIPENTMTWCLWDGHPFECLPTYLPISFINDTYIKMGEQNSILFCSFNCACAYNYNLKDDKMWERYQLLCKYYFDINKKEIKSIANVQITPAGSKEMINSFGGPMSIEQFRLGSKIVGRSYQTMIPPFVSSPYFFKEITTHKTKNIHASYMINNHPNSRNGFQRKKPPLNKQSKTIEDFSEII